MSDLLTQLSPMAQQIVTDRVIYISGFSREEYPVIQIHVDRLDLANNEIKEQFLQAFKYVIEVSKSL